MPTADIDVCWYEVATHAALVSCVKEVKAVTSVDTDPDKLAHEAQELWDACVG